MSELISGEDVVLALLEGKDLLWKKTEWDNDEKEPVFKSMWNIEELLTGETVIGEVVEFYLKPRTITINGIEVPAPFEPKRNEQFYTLNAFFKNGYERFRLSDDYDSEFQSASMNFVWRTEEEIKQVVAALREVFK